MQTPGELNHAFGDSVIQLALRLLHRLTSISADGPGRVAVQRGIGALRDRASTTNVQLLPESPIP